MTKIIHSEMVAGLKKPGDAIMQTLTPEKVDAWHMTSCIPGEAGELFDAIRNNDKENVTEELGDMEFYVEGTRQGFGITREETVAGDDADWDSLTWMDLPGKAADVFDAVKKHVIYNKEHDRSALVKALNVLEVVLDKIRLQFGITRDEAVEHNIGKLGKRYEGLKYSDASAQNRADKVA